MQAGARPTLGNRRRSHGRDKEGAAILGVSEILSLKVIGESSNLDFLRSVAIGAVLLAHCTGEFGFNQFALVGRGGVLLFFVHTALVLMFSLERLSSWGKFTLAFYVQRIFRIYPLCWACILAVLVFHIPGSSPYRWIGWKNLAYNLLLIQNLTFAPLISGPLWSLPYEIQMYVALPFLFLLTRRKRPLLSLSLCWLGSAASAIWLNRFYVAKYGPDYNYDTLHSPLTWFVPCFLGGVFAYVLSKRSRAILPFAVLPPLLLGLLLISAFTPFKHADWISCTVLGALLPYIVELRSNAARVAFHRIAKYSYGAYLFHAPLLWLYFRYLHIGPLLVSWMLFGASLMLVSVMGYHAIEKPFIDIGRSTARRLARYESARAVYAPLVR